MTALEQGTTTDQLIDQCDVSHNVIREHYARHLQPKMFREELIRVSHIQNP
jgi:hypothetical protein